MSDLAIHPLASQPMHPPIAASYAESYTEPEVQSSAQSLVPLIAALSHTPSATKEKEAFVPPVPQSFEAVGVSEGLVEELVLKTLYARGPTIGRDLATELGLKFSLIEPIIEMLKRQRMIEAKGSLGFGSVSAVFGISEAGRTRVRECLEHNQYVGPTPIPIAQYEAAVRAQRLK